MSEDEGEWVEIEVEEEEEDDDSFLVQTSPARQHEGDDQGARPSELSSSSSRPRSRSPAGTTLPEKLQPGISRWWEAAHMRLDLLLVGEETWEFFEG